MVSGSHNKGRSPISFSECHTQPARVCDVWSHRQELGTVYILQLASFGEGQVANESLEMFAKYTEEENRPKLISCLR